MAARFRKISPISEENNGELITWDYYQNEDKKYPWAIAISNGKIHEFHGDSIEDVLEVVSSEPGDYYSISYKIKLLPNAKFLDGWMGSNTGSMIEGLEEVFDIKFKNWYDLSESLEVTEEECKRWFKLNYPTRSEKIMSQRDEGIYEEVESNYKVSKFVNLTPHIVTLRNEENEIYFQPSGKIAKVTSTTSKLNQIQMPFGQVTLSRTILGEPIGVPEPVEGTMYIVSGYVRIALPDRNDLCSPDTGPDAIRSKSGKVLAVRRFLVN